MKQTAVEWFVEQLKSTRKKYMGYKNIEIDYKELIQQAKAMEKEQIVYAHIAGMEFIAVDPKHYIDDANEYYNAEYKGDKQ